MSELTSNRGVAKAVDADDAEVYLTVDLAAALDDYDTHTHPASDIASGTVSPDRLGSGGDGSGDHFLADDGTWKTVAGGGVVDAADVTYTGTLDNVDVAGALDELDTEKAPVTHTHDASAITAGTVDPARLGTGAGANTVLHGDSTFGGINASSQITAGTVPPNRLGAGTTDSSHLLDGSSNWRLLTAADIASGTVDPDRLGTGSDASGDNFLADDSTWKTVPQSLPAAGTTGQALVKTSDSDFAAAWTDVVTPTSHDLIDHAVVVAATVDLADLHDVTIASSAAGHTIVDSGAFGWVNTPARVATGRLYAADRYR